MAKKTFKTESGTVLPLLNLRGKEYLQVAHRLVWFREEHPDWIIKTTLVKDENDTATMRADIYSIRQQINTGVDGTTNSYPERQLVATAHKRESKSSFSDYIEKAETGAIGRALALCGYGTQFTADELEEGERIVDAPTTPAKRPNGFRTTL